MDARVIIFLGRSGSGKGTQAKLLKATLEEKFGTDKVLYFESGDVFRAYIEKGSYSSTLSKKVMEEGGLQPNFLAVRGWANFFVDHFTGNERIIIDGSPRTEMEAQELDRALTFYGLKASVVYLNISRDEAVRRLEARGRSDDASKENIKKRMDWFEQCVEPVLTHYREGNQNIFLDINGEQDIDAIHREVLKQTGLLQ